MATLGLQMGLESGKFCKRQHRWMFTVANIIGERGEASIRALPPEKSARPSIGFKENSVRHLVEDVFYPAKPDWRPISITVFDLKKLDNPIFRWIQEFYEPQIGVLFYPNSFKGPNEGFIRECSLELYDGCGGVVERWIYEDAWPQSINFQSLDMTQQGIVMADITLRYARAYLID